MKIYEFLCSPSRLLIFPTSSEDSVNESVNSSEEPPAAAMAALTLTPQQIQDSFTPTS